MILALRDEHFFVKYGVVEALTEIGDSQAIEPLIIAFTNEKGDVRDKIAWALGSFKDYRAVEPLISALKDQSNEEIYWTIWALGEIEDSRAVEPLTAIIDENYKSDNRRLNDRDAEEALNKIINKNFDESLVKEPDIPMAMEVVFDAFYQDNKYIMKISDYQRSSEHMIIPPGRYTIVRLGIGKTSESEYGPIGANSIILIEALVLQFVPRDFFYKCTWTPANYEKFGLSINHLDSSVLTEEQRNKTIEVLSEQFEWWWENATVDVKEILGGRVSEKDKALTIYGKARDAYYSEQKFDKAKKLFKEAIAMDIGITGARSDLGMIAIDEGDLATAIKMFKEELKYAAPPMEHTAHLCLAAIYQAIGQVDEASTHTNEAERIDSHTNLHIDVVRKINLASKKEQWGQTLIID
ncbi:MAG: HEAT repeat domain-containing protein [Pseudomonadota bacterium]